MAENFTPGPWRAETWVHEKPIKIHGDSARRIVPVSGGPAIAYLPTGREDIMAANASLMAEAPKLLEALKHATAMMEIHKDRWGDPGKLFDLEKYWEVIMQAESGP